MKIRWFGHSCFYITSDKGTRILTDPFDATVGYDIPDVEADLVTVSHQHFDHSYTEKVMGDYELINKPGEDVFHDIEIKGIMTYHDEVGGKKRGSNIVFVLKIECLNICHLGDLGHIPDEKQLKQIGKIDILLIPVGGTYTIDADQAVNVVNLMKPKVVIPMHYKTPDLKFGLDNADGFVEKLTGYSCESISEIEVNKGNINQFKNKIIILDYK